MSALHELITQIVAANGGTIVGKTVLQKMFFLLDHCGMNSGCRYDYYYYGPFSREVAEAAEDAAGLKLLNYRENPGYHAVPYGIYEVGKDVPLPPTIGGLAREDLEKNLSVMRDYSPIELELAATIVYLRDSGSRSPTEDVRQLKPLKATAQRLQKADALLKQLGIGP